MAIYEIIGTILILIGTVFIGLGIAGLYRFSNFFTRSTISSVIDTAGFILMLLGVMFYKQFSLFTVKIGIILFFMLFLNPLSNHVIVRGAYRSGLAINKGTQADDKKKLEDYTDSL